MTQTLDKPATSEREHEGPPPRIHWTRSQVQAIREAGILNGRRYELIKGELYNKMGQKPPHAYAIERIREWLSGVFGANHVRDQKPIHVAPEDDEDSEPEPDVAVTLEPYQSYATRHPGPGDLALVVEISDSTVAFDRGTKAGLYARAGIQEYWIVDVKRRVIEVYRRPSPDGYEERTTYREDGQVSPLARPDARVRVAELLPPADEPKP